MVTRFNVVKQLLYMFDSAIWVERTFEVYLRRLGELEFPRFTTLHRTLVVFPPPIVCTLSAVVFLAISLTPDRI